MKTLSAVLSVVILAAAGCVPSRWSDLDVLQLRCEFSHDPLGVDAAQPRLSWQLRALQRAQVQSAYQVLAATTPDLLALDQGDLWDSGRVTSDQTVDVAYRGRPLASAQQVFWKVRIWDGRGRVTAWSLPGQWTMGLLAPAAATVKPPPAGSGGSGQLSSAATPAGWQARWITDAGLFRWLRPVYGYHSEETTDPATIKWVQLDLGAPKAVSAVQLFALRYGVIDGLGFPRKFKVEVSDDPTFATGTLIADFSRKEFPNPWLRRIDLPATPAVTGRYVRLTANGLRVEEGRACLALSQIVVLSGGVNVAVGAPVTASDSQEQGPWGARAVTDGLGVPGANPRANTTLLLRREFTVRPGLRRALVFACGLGQYQLTFNGRPSGAPAIAPGWTDFAKTCLYDTLDVTALLQPGANAVGLALAGGMYNVQDGRYVKFVTPFRPLTAIAELRLEYADGSVQTVSTDEQWRVASGPVTFANMYGGEDYDARLEPRGWDRPGFDASSWTQATLWAGPGGTLRGHSYAAPPVREFETLPTVAHHELRPGVTVYDLGQNAAIMLRLKVHGPAGATVRILPAELLAPDGSVDQSSVGHSPVWWQYTLAGGGGESWAPGFFYHGCRYLQVECSPPALSHVEGPAPSKVEGPRVEAGPTAADWPVVNSLAGVVVQAAAPPAGEFACSNDLFNRIHNLVRWAQRSNMMSVLTDCPHRERLGWLEQDHLNGPALRYEFNLGRLFAKVTDDMADAQRPDGLVPDIAPEYIIFTDGFRNSPEWGSACILIPWQQFQWTDDTSLLRRSYGMMKRYLDFLDRRADHHLLNFGLGDWYDLGPKPPGVAQLTPIALTATAFYYEDAEILSRVAVLVGKGSEARHYRELATQIRTAFNRAFYDPAQGQYATGSQCADAIPLVLGLAEPEHREAVLAALVKDVQDRGDALTAGDVGYRYLLRALADGGRSDLVYAMNDQSDKPGYGYQLRRGATSLTEAWDASRHASQNHFMLGQINEWFYHDLAGVQDDPSGPGFKRIIIRPAVVGNLTWVRARYDSVRGRIVSEWRRNGDQFMLQVTIPANTTANVYVPTVNAAMVAESGRPAADADGVRYVGRKEGVAVFAVGSGIYTFTSTLPER